MTNKVDEIVKERGGNYGHPKHHFRCTSTMAEVWRITAEQHGGIGPDLFSPLSHGVYMICDKLARAAKNPHHIDNWDDIEGYVKCIRMLLEDSSNHEQARGQKNDTERREG